MEEFYDPSSAWSKVMALNTFWSKHRSVRKHTCCSVFAPETDMLVSFGHNRELETKPKKNFGVCFGHVAAVPKKNFEGKAQNFYHVQFLKNSCITLTSKTDHSSVLNIWTEKLLSSESRPCKASTSSLWDVKFPRRNVKEKLEY